ncbi:MAG TPA: peptidase MA family metallohydrolase [bacterium]|nr:peptidase MA family metallohydrolase [bacterium]HPP86314.1 peptidase MA family metallohydrolase [bacterium]
MKIAKKTFLVLILIFILTNCANKQINPIIIDDQYLDNLLVNISDINDEILENIYNSNSISPLKKQKFYLDYFNKLRFFFNDKYSQDYYFFASITLSKYFPQITQQLTNDLIILFKQGNYHKTLYYINQLERHSNLSTELIELKCYCYYYTQNIYDFVQYHSKFKNENFSQQFRNFLKKISNELPVEFYFMTHTARNFEIHYSNSLKFENIQIIANYLEDAVNYVNRIFGWYPSDKITVLIYEYGDYYKQHDILNLSSGLFDGKIRIPLSNNIAIENLKQTIFHEYAHSMQYQVASNSMRFYWLTEGIAKYVEASLNNLNVAKPEVELIKFSEIDNVFNFEKNNTDKLRAAYYQAYLIVKYIADNFGERTIGEIIKKFKYSNNIDKILKQEIFIDTNELFRNLNFLVEKL